MRTGSEKRYRLQMDMLMCVIPLGLLKEVFFFVLMEWVVRTQSQFLGYVIKKDGHAGSRSQNNIINNILIFKKKNKLHVTALST